MADNNGRISNICPPTPNDKFNDAASGGLVIGSVVGQLGGAAALGGAAILDGAVAEEVIGAAAGGMLGLFPGAVVGLAIGVGVGIYKARNTPKPASGCVPSM